MSARGLLLLICFISTLALVVLYLDMSQGSVHGALKSGTTAGELDPSFGNGGIVTTNIAGDGRSEKINATRIQPDGKIVAAGSSAIGNFMLVRYNPDGTLDNSFGNGGKITTDLHGAYEQATALALQHDGRIVVAGSSSWQGGVFALARYNTDGTLDSTFGVSGTVTTQFDGGSAEIAAIRIQQDGKIVAAGSGPGVNADFALARYNSDGTLDISFGNGGRVLTDLTPSTVSYDHALAVALQRDGKIVAGGSTSSLTPLDFALVRYNPDGSLDASFGNGGKEITSFGPDRNDTIHALEVQQDGRILAAGESRPSPCCNGNNFALARYYPDGTLDPDFGIKGKLTTDIAGRDDIALSLALQPDNKFVAAGLAYVSSYNSPDFALVRYNLDGSLDPDFGNGGKVTTDNTEKATTVTVQVDGKIVAGGSANSGETRSSDFATVRYQSNGKIDTSFGAGGIVTTDFDSGNDDSSHDLIIQQDGRIVLVGVTSGETGGDFALGATMRTVV